MAPPTGLSPKQLRLLGRLKSLRATSDFYLAGGSAVAWHFEHRQSIDLDFFSRRTIAGLERVITEVTRETRARVRVETDVMVGLDAAGLPIDFVRYPYPPLEKPKPGPVGFAIAGPRDLGVMKLAAIARRGLRRDFWDLYVIVKMGRLSVPALLAAYQRRYRLAASDAYHVARSLSFFDDAERDDPRVVGLSAPEWLEIKRFFLVEARKLVLP